MFKKITNFFENLVDPYPKDITKYTTKNLFSFIWSCTNGLRKYICLITIFTSLIGILEVLIFSVISGIVDKLSKISSTQLWHECANSFFFIILVLLLNPVIVTFLTLFKFQTLQGNFPMRLRWNLHRLLLNQDINFFHDEFSGSIATKVMQTALAIRNIIIAFFDTLVFITIYFISSAVVLSNFNILLLLPFCIWIVMYLLICYYFLPKLTNVAKKQSDTRSFLTGCISDIYTNIFTVKLFSHTQREADYIRSAMKKYMGPVYEQQRLVSGFDISSYTLNMFMVLSISIISLWLWMEGKVGVGVVGSSILMAMRFNSVSQWSMWVAADFFEHLGTAKDGITMLSYTNKLNDKKYAPKLKVSSGEVLFKNVRFSYNSGKNILENFNFKIKPGEKVGLIGYSGAGKSTIVNLLLRFYDVDSGKILIDGQDISSVTQESLRSQIGMVTQDTLLLHRSIKDNISYGCPGASDDEIIKAATKAEANLFIKSLKDSYGRVGYETCVGERGVKLSGGQRQRILIARVILKNAPILLLDEATSALDSEVEAAIQNSLHAIMNRKTVIVIAHRLSTIAAMDRLIILDKGHIIEEGNHYELLKYNGVYSQLWNHQNRGFL